jgi:hypothetical protein
VIAGPAACWLRRLGTAGLLAVLLVGLAAVPALAHTRAAAASDYDSRITALPALPGVHWRVYAGGDVLELTNRGPEEVLVLGYADEPYLRVGPDGVFENRRSPATYLNADRYADVAMPPRADPQASPDWVKVSEGQSRAWHDHRVHWMSPDPPPHVQQDPGQQVLIQPWSVAVVHGGQPYEVTGELWWNPGPSPVPFLGLALLVTAPALAGLLRGRRGHALRRPAAVVVGGVALLNGIHFVDELLAWPAATLDVLFGIFHTALFVGVGLVGAAVAWRGNQGPHLSLGIASGAVLFHQGLLQLRLLWSSQLPTVWPPALLRTAVALSVAQALWVAVVLTAALREPDPHEQAAPGATPAALGGPVAPPEGVRSAP